MNPAAFAIEAIPITHRVPDLGDGDSTITFHGALGRTLFPDDRVYVVDKGEHLEMAQMDKDPGDPQNPNRHPNVLKLVQFLIEGRICTLPQAQREASFSTFRGPPVGSLEPVPAPPPPAGPPLPAEPALLSSSETEENAGAADRWLVQVRGAAQLEIEDEAGRRVGPSEDEELPGVFEIGIPDATYTPGLTFTSVFLGHPGRYTFTLSGLSESTVDFRITGFTETEQLETVFWQGLSFTDQSQAQLTYDTSDPSPSLALSVEGDDEIEEIPPTAILTATEAKDTLPPTTELRIEDGNVVLSATDDPGGSGVLRSYYTTDARGFSVYGEPFPIPPEAKIVMGFSVDRNGNIEYPGSVLPVLGLSETSLVFEAAACDPDIPPQRVRISNLDPISVSGELDWEASTDVEWLSLGPGEGRTPGLLVISARAEGLEPGTYEGNVIVRSRTEPTVFGEQAISVRLRIGDVVGPG